MAWKKRYSNFRGNVKRRFSGARKRYGKSAGIGGTFLLGAIIGLTDYDKQIPYELKIGLACIPGGLINKVPMGSKAKTFAQGLLIGDIIQNRTGINLLGGVGNASGSVAGAGW